MGKMVRSMEYPHFTIVVPTRNRLESLKHTIKTCTDQNYDNFTVIVASNNCSDETVQYISSLKDERIIQIESNIDLPMVLNWSRVMPEAIALDGYITYLGDDDGLLPGALSLASKLILKTGCAVLSWRKVEYAWPDVLVEEYKNYLSISIDEKISLRNSDEFLKKVHDYSCGYDEGPGIYSSFISASVLKGLMPSEETAWFSGGSPDIYSSYVIATAVKEYYKCSFGLSINGASGRSNGTAYMHRPQSEMAAEFKKQNTLHPALCHAPSVTIAETDALLVARERLPDRFKKYVFSWQLLIQRMLGEIKRAPSKIHYDQLVLALNKIIEYSGEEQPELPQFTARAIEEKEGPNFGIDLQNKLITVDLERMKLTDVYGASLFADTIFPLVSLNVDQIFINLSEQVGLGNLNIQNEYENTVDSKYRAASAKEIIKAIIRPIRKYARWIRNQDKIEKWFMREPSITKWFANEEIVEAALHLRDIQVGKEMVAATEFEEFKRLSDQLVVRRLKVDWEDRYLCLDDKSTETGFDRHYIYHPAWAARILMQTHPKRHTDISSTLNFCTIVSAFIPVDFYDYRPAPIHLPGLNSLSANLVELPFRTDSLESVSCMHVLEHVGLGRYGDPIDPDGDLRAIRELCRVVAPGGNLLVVVPVGAARVQFNAHRIYKHGDFLTYFKELELVEFALIPDGLAPDGLIFSAPEHLVDSQSYGCGCYWFKKNDKHVGYEEI